MIKKIVLSLENTEELSSLAEIFPKELWPLGGLPLIHHLVNKARDLGVEEFIFLGSSEKKILLNYFENFSKKEENKNEFKEIVFSFNLQKKSQGLLPSEKYIGEEPFGFIFPENIVYSHDSSFFQIYSVFRTCQKPVIALRKSIDHNIPTYGFVNVEKIANRFYKIKEVFTQKELKNSSYDFVISGRGILTPLIFDYLKKARLSSEKSADLAVALDFMIKDGKTIYGHEMEGKWLDCREGIEFLKSDLFLTMKNKDFGLILKKYLKEIQ